jgi:hypothetical protein
MKTGLLMLIFLATASPVLANDSQITCAALPLAFGSQELFLSLEF